MQSIEYSQLKLTTNNGRSFDTASAFLAIIFIAWNGKKSMQLCWIICSLSLIKTNKNAIFQTNGNWEILHAGPQKIKESFHTYHIFQCHDLKSHFVVQISDETPIKINRVNKCIEKITSHRKKNVKDNLSHLTNVI